MELMRDEADSLASLEERIYRAVEMVTALRQEKEDLLRRLDEAEAERAAAQQAVADAMARADRIGQELDALRQERKQVRTRIEKLKDQLELLGAS